MARARSDVRLQLLRAVLATFCAGYLAVHLMQQAVVSESRAAWIAGMGAPSPPSAWQIAALSAFALLGASALWPWSSASPTERSRRRLERTVAVLTLAFLAGHAVQVVVGSGPHASAGDAYMALADALGRPLPLTGYVVGITATCAHLGLSLLAWEAAAGIAASAVPVFRALCFASSAVLWLGSLSVLSYFALGTSLF